MYIRSFIKDLANHSWSRYLIGIDVVNILIDVLVPSYNLGLFGHLTFLTLSVLVASYQIYAENKHRLESGVAQLPKLVLKLFDMHGNRSDFLDQMSLTLQEHAEKFHLYVGLVALNQAQLSTAENLSIYLEISWSGEELVHAVTVQVPKDSRWSDDYHHISGTGGPARLKFNGNHTDRLPYGHPLQWQDFRMIFSGRYKGQLLLDYKISSGSPLSQSEGRLLINVS